MEEREVLCRRRRTEKEIQRMEEILNLKQISVGVRLNLDCDTVFHPLHVHQLDFNEII